MRCTSSGIGCDVGFQDDDHDSPPAFHGSRRLRSEIRLVNPALAKTLFLSEICGMDQKTKKLWGGRFEQATDAAVERFTASIHFDRALARYDLRVSAAHARMLGRAG